jgi:hypothetical protein
MNRVLRISILVLIVAAAFAGNTPKAPMLASNLHSSVPGGDGPMPTCNPFTSDKCPSIR